MGSISLAIVLLLLFIGNHFSSSTPFPFPIGVPASLPPPQPSEWNGKTFDFIVVGGGVAGCTIARRLAETGEHTVLLIELGGLPDPKLEIPLISVDFLDNPDYVNVVPSVPQKHAGLANNGITFLKRGRTLGGGSGVNGMVFNRGSPHDYNNWAELTGDQSWSFDGMLKYFRRYENYAGHYPSDLHGFGGPITVNSTDYAPSLRQWLDGGMELGYPTRDPNGHQTVSFALEEFAQNHGRRVSSFYGYIRPLLEEKSNDDDKGSPLLKGALPNLFVLIHSEVTKLILEGNLKLKATGVEIVTNFTLNTFAKARKEIILCAGALGSPVILQRSGIGPRFILERERILLRKELPVGLNLHDHVLTSQTVIFNNRSAVLDPVRDKTDTNFRLWLETGDGPYSNYLGAAGQAFLHLSKDNFLDWANIHLITVHLAQDPSDPNELGPNEVETGWLVFLTRPRSRGILSINTSAESSHGFDTDFRYLTHPEDLEELVEAMKFTVKLCENTRAFQSLGCRLPKTGLDQCKMFPYRSDDYWRCYVEQTSDSAYHPAGSCRMGSGAEDPEAVVDTELKVIGVKGCRVADAGIMVQATNANTHAPVYAIAEKASELILNSWRKDNRQSAPPPATS